MSAPEDVGGADSRVWQWSVEGRNKTLTIEGRIARGDVSFLCERVGALLQKDGADLIVCDVRALEHPDIDTVDALARLQLAARREGSCIRLLHACPELKGLLVLTGLCEVLPSLPQLGVECQRDPKERKQSGSVEEEADPTDTSV